MKCRKICAIVLTLGLGLSLLPVNTLNKIECGAAEKENNYLVMADNKDNLREVRDICKDEYQAEEVQTISALRGSYSDNYTVCKLSKSEAEELADKENIIVEKDQIISACTSDEEGMVGQDAEWNIQMVRAEEERTAETGNKKIKVAVLDSGVDDFNDLHLAGSINLIPGEEEVLPLFWDVTGHGSSVAGIIAAEKNDIGITGIAPETEIYAAKVLDEKNQAPVSRVIEGIYWAIENKVNIINMSFGLKNDSAALHKAVKDAYDAGMLLVAAAGNGENVEYPAAYDEVIAVGSVDTAGTVSEKSASGNELELAAPGEQICSTGAFEGTLICAGTSMAAPHVTGIAARLWAKDTSVSAEFIRQLMSVSANECGEKDSYGNGLVDLAYAEEIYDTYKANFVGKKDLLENIAENDATIQKNDGVEYVEGRWSKDKHEETIVNSSLSASEISIIKSGTVYNDISSFTVNLGDHPYWHGGYKGPNYISCYMYVTNVANTFKNGGSLSSVSKPIGFSDIDKAGMDDGILEIRWQNVLASVNGKNQSLFMLGMAIHIATDVYAHSAWGNFDTYWEHLDHKGYNNGIADMTESKRDQYGNVIVKAFPYRYVTAKEVAKQCLKTYVNGSKGRVNDFNPSGAYVNAGVNWKIKYLYEFAKVHSESVANSLKNFSC